MPSPIGHALAGLIVHSSLADRRSLEDWPRMALVVAAACAPDLDLLQRFIAGAHSHRAESHSLGMALAVAAATYGVARARRWPRAGALAALVGLGWCSHLLLDWLGSDTAPPFGLMALWPWSREWWKAPVVLFLDIGRTLDLSTVRQNVLAAAWEVALLLPILSVVLWFRQRKS